MILEIIAAYWWVWVLMFIVSAAFVGYSHWKARQQKNFVLTGTMIGCLAAIFSSIGAISAVLSIIAAVLKIIAWKITGG